MKYKRNNECILYPILESFGISRRFSEPSIHEQVPQCNGYGCLAWDWKDAVHLRNSTASKQSILQPSSPSRKSTRSRTKTNTVNTFNFKTEPWHTFYSLLRFSLRPNMYALKLLVKVQSLQMGIKWQSMFHPVARCGNPLCVEYVVSSIFLF